MFDRLATYTLIALALWGAALQLPSTARADIDGSVAQRIALARVPGEVRYMARGAQRGGRPVYDVHILNRTGCAYTVLVDAYTGAVLKVEHSY